MASSSAGGMNGGRLPTADEVLAAEVGADAAALAAALPAAATALGNRDTQTGALISRRIRVFEAKLKRIADMEERLVQIPDLKLEKEQKALVTSKPTLQAVVDELRLLVDLIRATLVQDVASAIDKNQKIEEKANKAIIQKEREDRARQSKEKKALTRKATEKVNQPKETEKQDPEEEKAKRQEKEKARELEEEKAKLKEPPKEIPPRNAKEDAETQIRSIKRALAVLASSSSASKQRQDLLKSIKNEIEFCSSLVQNESTPANVPSSSSGHLPTSSSGGGAATTTPRIDEAGQDEEILKEFQNFLESYTAQIDKDKYYIGEALSMATRKSRFLFVKYAHMEKHSRDWAMKICADHGRLIRRLEQISRQFVLSILSSMLSRDKYVEIEDNAKNLLLKFVKMPKSHQMLEDALSQGTTVGNKAYGFPDPVKIPSPRGCILLRGVMQDMLKKHRAGFSWKGTLKMTDIEAYNGHRVVITKVPSKVDLGHDTLPKESTDAFQKDLAFVATSVLSKFKVGGQPPHFDPFMRFLQAPNPVFLTNLDSLSAYHDLLLHNWFVKPPVASMNLLLGIHSSCRSHDSNDTEAFFKTVLEDHDYSDASGTTWIELVEDSHHSSMTDVLKYPTREGTIAGIPKPDPYNSSFESCSGYLRHLISHGTAKSLSKPVYRRLTQGADGPKDTIMRRMPREQYVKQQEELEISAAVYLDDVMGGMLELLLLKSAMTGMLNSHWKTYKQCNYTVEDDLTGDLAEDSDEEDLDL